MAGHTDQSLIRKEWTLDTLGRSSFSPYVHQKTPSQFFADSVIQGDVLRGIRSYNRKDAKLNWFFPVAGGIETDVVLDKNKLFFGGADGFFYSIDARTSLISWKFYVGSENIGTPFVYKNTVYFMTSKNKIYALNSNKGKVVWIHSQPNQVISKSSGFSIHGVSQPFVESNRVYAGFSNGLFVAINRKTGRWIWKISLSKATSRFQDSDSHPLVYGSYIYVSSYSGGFFCLDKKTGRLLWKNTNGAFANPTIDKNVIYYSSSNNKLLALDRLSGRVLWSKDLMGSGTQPVIYKSKLIYGVSNGGLFIADKKTGHIDQHVDSFKGIFAKPSLKGSDLFVMSLEAWLYKFNLIF